MGQHRLRTGSDKEIALHLFEDFGPSAVRRLDGKCALAIIDGEDLFLVRDPMGIEPLYYVDREEDAGKPKYFASEIKALGDLHQPVREFPPGTCWYSPLGRGTGFYRQARVVPGPLHGS